MDELTKSGVPMKLWNSDHRPFFFPFSGEALLNLLPGVPVAVISKTVRESSSKSDLTSVLLISCAGVLHLTVSSQLTLNTFMPIYCMSHYYEVR